MTGRAGSTFESDASSDGGAGGSKDESDTSFGGENWAEGVLEALKRASKRAHLVAYQTGTGVVERRNGKMEVYPPDPIKYEDLIPPPFVDSYEIADSDEIRITSA
ncbi:MAG: hypothetical protein OXE79_04800 [Acidimicrobiaceae bacterium]|nr:hypothetical protein [Acidimicrobiaceae bacterium]MCY4281223.1 hypothetical protein [Acidimicrobiaceae bacterium]